MTWRKLLFWAVAVFLAGGLGYLLLRAISDEAVVNYGWVFGLVNFTAIAAALIALGWGTYRWAQRG